MEEFTCNCTPGSVRGVRLPKNGLVGFEGFIVQTLMFAPDAVAHPVSVETCRKSCLAENPFLKWQLVAYLACGC